MGELIIYPTLYGVRQHRAKQLEGKIGVTGEYPVTYEVFIQKCIEKDIRHLTFLGDFKKNVVISRIFDKLSKKLTYFNKPRDGYIHRIGEVIGELKRQDMDPQTFKTMSKHTSANNDIALMYSAYQDFLCQNHLYDQEDRYIICKNSIYKNEYISSYSKIHFREFFEFLPIQSKIIETLGDKVKVSNSSVTPRINDLAVVKAQDRRTEVFSIAHQILEDLSEGLLPENMCIVLRQRDIYTSLLLEVFERAHIPLRLERGANLLQNPFVKGLLSALHGNRNSYFDEELFPAISSDKLSIGQWAQKLLELLEDQGFPEKFTRLTTDSLEMLKRDLEAHKALWQLLADLCEIEQLFPGRSLSFNGFISYMKLYLRERNYDLNAKKDGIWVMSPTMLRGLDFEKIYFLGMVDGEYPRDFRPDWLLKNEQREAINRKGHALDTVDSLLNRERESFRFLLSASSQGYFSYPLLLENNAPSLISPFLENLIEIVDSCHIKTVDFASVYCRKDIMISTDTEKTMPENLKDKIKTKFHDYPFSITAFNTYGECPFKFFLSRVLDLTPEEPMEFTAVNRGNTAHEVLEVFFKKHREELIVENMEQYVGEIRVLVEAIFQRENYKNHFPHPRLVDIEKEEIIGNITSYFEYQVKNQGDFLPYQMELGFGYHEKFYLDPYEDILLCGKIDRIDIDPAGNLVVLDYKNNWTPDIAHIEEGTNLQMPIYIMAAEKLLGMPVLGGAFISIKKGKVENIIVRDRNLPFVSKRRRKGILSIDEWESLMGNAANTIKLYAANIRQGKFPMEPKKCPKLDKFGAFCDFTRVCPFKGGE